MTKRDIGSFMKENIKAVEEVDVKISERMGNFTMKPVGPKVIEALQQDATKITMNKKSGQREKEFDQKKFLDLLAAESTVFPPLKDETLQANWGVLGEVALVKEMLGTGGEYANWIDAAMKVNEFEEGLEDLIEEAKN